ncbi:Cobalamin biosynthesis protein CobD [Azospirillaceae bacterium]
MILLCALVLDAIVGDPLWLYARVAHPVTVFGGVIAALDQRLNHGSESRRRWAGIGVMTTLTLGAAILAHFLEAVLTALPFGWLIEAALASTLLAQRSLYDHVDAVAEELFRNGLEGGRRAVAQIVGRDPQSLDEAGVARAAIESCAENFSDGVVAPAFWFLVLGLPGLVAYKLVNTADSMIGHRTPRHEAFGWAAARFDDVLNLFPARLSGCLIALGAGSTESLRIMLRDAHGHRSPNAGWPEAAMAGALRLALAGPRAYNGTIVDDPWMGEGGWTAATAGDIRRAIALFLRACGWLWVITAIIGFL